MPVVIKTHQVIKTFQRKIGTKDVLKINYSDFTKNQMQRVNSRYIKNGKFDQTKTIDVMYDLLSYSIRSWEGVVDEQGNKLRPTPEVIAELPQEYLADFFEDVITPLYMKYSKELLAEAKDSESEKVKN